MNERQPTTPNRVQGRCRAEALAAFEHAVLLAGEAPHDPARDERLAALKERLDAEERDQEFIARFEAIRLRVESLVDVKKNRSNEEAALPEIKEALRQYGIAVGDLAPAEAAARIQARPEPVRSNLIAALDECFFLLGLALQRIFFASFCANVSHPPLLSRELG